MARAEAEPLEFAGVVVRPGRRARVELPVTRLPTGTPVSLPVAVLNGRHAGPRLWISAAIHGDELNGLEVVRRVLERLDPRSLRGAVIAVPTVNVLGFVEQTRDLPDGRDLNRSFPGSPRGSLAARLAHLFMSEVVARCRYGIDIHTAAQGRVNLPQVRADLEEAETRRLATAFGAPVAIHSRLRDGSLREAATKRGAHVLLYEAGEALRFDREAIEAGLRGVFAVLRALDMVAEEPDGPAPPAPFQASGSLWIRAGHGGVFRSATELGASVAEGETVGSIADVFGGERRPVRARVAGRVVGLTTNPLVYRGDALVHVAHA